MEGDVNKTVKKTIKATCKYIYEAHWVFTDLDKWMRRLNTS